MANKVLTDAPTLGGRAVFGPLNICLIRVRRPLRWGAKHAATEGYTRLHSLGRHCRDWSCYSTFWDWTRKAQDGCFAFSKMGWSFKRNISFVGVNVSSFLVGVAISNQKRREGKLGSGVVYSLSLFLVRDLSYTFPVFERRHLPSSWKLQTLPFVILNFPSKWSATQLFCFYSCKDIVSH